MPHECIMYTRYIYIYRERARGPTGENVRPGCESVDMLRNTHTNVYGVRHMALITSHPLKHDTIRVILYRHVCMYIYEGVYVYIYIYVYIYMRVCMCVCVCIVAYDIYNQTTMKLSQDRIL